MEANRKLQYLCRTVCLFCTLSTLKVVICACTCMQTLLKNSVKTLFLSVFLTVGKVWVSDRTDTIKSYETSWQFDLGIAMIVITAWVSVLDIKWTFLRHVQCLTHSSLFVECQNSASLDFWHSIIPTLRHSCRNDFTLRVLCHDSSVILLKRYRVTHSVREQDVQTWWDMSKIRVTHVSVCAMSWSEVCESVGFGYLPNLTLRHPKQCV